MNRTLWQQLAEDRILDAEALLVAQRCSAAYYLAGYAVECALKACVVVRVGAMPEVVFEDKRFSEKCWTHNFEELVRLAGLDRLLASELASNQDRNQYWRVLLNWNEQSRYRNFSQLDAAMLFEAITHNKNGILTWLKVHW